MEYMANLSRQFLGRGARSAVVALSSYLTYEQRLLVERAVFACGMSPIVVPSAALAAVAFSFLSGWFAVPQMPSNRRRVLAIDVGCTLDFALVEICGQIAEIHELGGDKYIGGDHVDWLMLRHCQQQYLTQFDVDLATHRESWSMLRSSCQTAKCVLSQNMRAEVTAPVGGHLKSMSMSRGRLEELILEVLEQFQEKIVSFRDKNVTDVLLIGGSARMPAFQRAVFDVFSPESGEQPSVHVLPNRLVQPDELVAAGAAIVAASSSLSVGELPGPNVRVAMCHDRRLSVDTSAGPLEIVPAGCRVPSSNSVTVRIRSRQSAITIRERGESRGPCLGLLYFYNLQCLPVSVELLEVRVFVHETMHLTVSLCSGEYELIRHDITLESISLAREAERACPRTTILPDHA
jgi:molecular chaperone DnaK (HSP70)